MGKNHHAGREAKPTQWMKPTQPLRVGPPLAALPRGMPNTAATLDELIHHGRASAITVANTTCCATYVVRDEAP